MCTYVSVYKKKSINRDYLWWVKGMGGMEGDKIRLYLFFCSIWHLKLQE